jgi:methylase of polypeptide subunit release factors
MQHHVFFLTFDNELNISPAGTDGKPLKRVLDAGTGTGIWAMDFADAHPETHVRSCNSSRQRKTAS